MGPLHVVGLDSILDPDLDLLPHPKTPQNSYKFGKLKKNIFGAQNGLSQPQSYAGIQDGKSNLEV
jgi:hypothetical protein